MHRNDLSALSASETARLVIDKVLSPVETTRAAIARIKAGNPRLNAVTFNDFDGAMDRAKRLEAAIMRGEAVGPLASVPTLIKDLFDFRPGWPSTLGGIPALKHNMAQFCSPHIERVERAGAILLGKTNSPVMGFGGKTDNPLFGPTATWAATSSRDATATTPMPSSPPPARTSASSWRPLPEPLAPKPRSKRLLNSRPLKAACRRQCRAGARTALPSSAQSRAAEK